MGLLPVLIVIVLALWQVGLLGYTYLLAGHAAREGARELAVNTTDAPKDQPYRDAAQQDLPKAWRKDAKIEIDEDDPVTVNVQARRAARAAGAQEPVQVSDHASTSVEDEPLPPSQTPSRRRSRDARASRDESGQASAELMGMIWWLLLVTVIVWQICSSRGPTRRSPTPRAPPAASRAAAATARRRPRTRSRGPLRKTQKIEINGEKATVEGADAARSSRGCVDSDQLLADRASAELPG